MIELCEPHFLQMDDKLLAGAGVQRQIASGYGWLVSNEPAEAYRYVIEGTSIVHRDDVGGRPQPALVCYGHTNFVVRGKYQRSDEGPHSIETNGEHPVWVLKPSRHGILMCFRSRTEFESAVVLAESGEYFLVRYSSDLDGIRYRAGCRNFSLQQAMQHWKGSPRKSFINALKREFFNFSLEQVK